MDPKSIQNWASRGLIIGQRDGTGKGHHIKFSWFNLMEIAIAAELVEAGFSSLQEAFEAAQLFSHVSSGSAKWVDDDGISDDEDEPYRSPGMVWHHAHGDTFLFLWKGGKTVRLIGNDGMVNVYSIAPHSMRKPTFVAVNVTEIFARVCHRLALEYREVLDEVYPEDAKA